MTDWNTFWKLIAQLVILCCVLAFVIAMGAALFIAVTKEYRREQKERKLAETQTEKAS